MKSWLSRPAAIAALAVLTMTTLTAPASAAPSRATLKAAANAVAFERVGGSNYRIYKEKYPKRLNWGNDGCSVPEEISEAYPRLAWVIEHYEGVFQKSCDRHDFGYRNFGSNTSTAGPHPSFSPTRATKDRIDTRFHRNMRIQCDQRYDDVWDIPANQACKAAAKVFHTAVKYAGDDAFFG